MNLKQAFLYTLIVSVAVSAVVGIAVLLIGDFGQIEIRVLMSTLTVTVTSILGLACGAYYESGRGEVLPKAGIALTLLAAAMTFLIIWNVLDDSEIFVKAATTAMLLAVSASHLSLLSMARLDSRFAWSRTAAFVFVGLLDAIVLLLIWSELDADGEIIPRVIGVLAILIASVTVVTPVFHKISSAERGLAEIDAEIAGLKARISELERTRADIEVPEVDEP